MSVIRKIIAQEAAVPLLAVLLLSIGLGFLVAWLMVTSIDDTYKVTWCSRHQATVAISEPARSELFDHYLEVLAGVAGLAA